MSISKTPLSRDVLQEAKTEHDAEFKSAAREAISQLSSLFAARSSGGSFLDAVLSKALNNHADEHSEEVVKLFEALHLENITEENMSGNVRILRKSIEILTGSNFFEDAEVFEERKPAKKIPKEYFCKAHFVDKMEASGIDAYLLAPVPFMGKGNCEAMIVIEMKSGSARWMRELASKTN